MDVTPDDEHTILSYFTAMQRASGYRGPCIITFRGKPRTLVRGCIA